MLMYQQEPLALLCACLVTSTCTGVLVNPRPRLTPARSFRFPREKGSENCCVTPPNHTGDGESVVIKGINLGDTATETPPGDCTTFTGLSTTTSIGALADTRKILKQDFELCLKQTSDPIVMTALLHGFTAPSPRPPSALNNCKFLKMHSLVYTKFNYWHATLQEG
jgi:hypothetical protein